MFRVLICFIRWIMSAYLYAYCIQLKWGCQELLHWSYSRLCQTAIFDCQIPQFSLRQPQANKLSWLFAIFVGKNHVFFRKIQVWINYPRKNKTIANVVFFQTFLYGFLCFRLAYEANLPAGWKRVVKKRLKSDRSDDSFLDK